MPWRERKSITALLRESALEGDQHESLTLRRSLGVWNLVSMGIGCTIGAGIFVLTGTAASYAGPAVAIAFVAAALACLCSALCYAELASMIPVSGSAYTYAYTTMGELVGWIVGWNLILEYLISASTVAVGWSAYVSAFLSGLGVKLPPALAESFLAHSGAVHSGMLNLPAAAIMLASTAVLARGVRESALVNNLMVAAKLLIILLVIVFGAAHIDSSNWHPFIPPNRGTLGQFGWSGVLRAAGVVFFAYIGFDVVSTSSQEARDPTRTVPFGLLIALAVCTVAYVAMSLVMTGLAPYGSLNVPNPVAVAIDHAGPQLGWLKPLVTAGAMIGLASTILVTLYGQVRIFFSMARDGLIPRVFGRLHPRYRVPAVGTWCCGICGAIVAAVLPIEVLGELVSIGTLLAFAIVCAGVLVLRRTEPNRPRAFRAPCVEVVGSMGIAMCLVLMIGLPPDTWIRLAVWLSAGLAVYFWYGRRHSKLSVDIREPRD